MNKFQKLKAFCTSVWNKRVSAGLAGVTSEDNRAGVIGQHNLWNDVAIEIDATDPPARLFNPMYAKHLGIINAESFPAVEQAVRAYVTQEATRIAQNMNVQGTWELIFAESEFPNDIYCFIRVNGFIR